MSSWEKPGGPQDPTEYFHRTSSGQEPRSPGFPILLLMNYDSELDINHSPGDVSEDSMEYSSQEELNDNESLHIIIISVANKVMLLTTVSKETAKANMAKVRDARK